MLTGSNRTQQAFWRARPEKATIRLSGVSRLRHAAYITFTPHQYQQHAYEAGWRRTALTAELQGIVCCAVLCKLPTHPACTSLLTLPLLQLGLLLQPLAAAGAAAVPAVPLLPLPSRVRCGTAVLAAACL